jgi:CHAT domain-containing protein
LITHHTVIHLSSLDAGNRDLGPPAVSPQKPLILFSRPDYSDWKDPRPPPLRNAKHEEEQILEHFPSNAIRHHSGRKATPEALLGLSNSPCGVLHVIAHAEADEERPWSSHLKLTGGTKKEGRVFRHEIYDLDLECDLVVLSACETGLGRYQRGEGVLGLGHAFLLANARQVVMTLWQVDDRTTADLMAHFYEGFAAGLPTAEALRQAQLWIAQQESRQDPYYWAPFVLVSR